MLVALTTPIDCNNNNRKRNNHNNDRRFLILSDEFVPPPPAIVAACRFFIGSNQDRGMSTVLIFLGDFAQDILFAYMFCSACGSTAQSIRPFPLNGSTEDAISMFLNHR